MAIPARLALWLGVILIIYGYLQKYGALTVIGSLFVLIGIGLWWFFREPKQKTSKQKTKIKNTFKNTIKTGLQKIKK